MCAFISISRFIYNIYLYNLFLRFIRNWLFSVQRACVDETWTRPCHKFEEVLVEGRTPAGRRDGGSGHGRSDRQPAVDTPKPAVCGRRRARQSALPFACRQSVGRAPPSLLPIPSGGHSVAGARVRCRLQLTDEDNVLFRTKRDFAHGWAEGARRRLFMAKKNETTRTLTYKKRICTYIIYYIDESIIICPRDVCEFYWNKKKSNYESALHKIWLSNNCVSGVMSSLMCMVGICRCIFSYLPRLSHIVNYFKTVLITHVWVINAQCSFYFNLK